MNRSVADENPLLVDELMTSAEVMEWLPGSVSTKQVRRVAARLHLSPSQGPRGRLLWSEDDARAMRAAWLKKAEQLREREARRPIDAPAWGSVPGD